MLKTSNDARKLLLNFDVLAQAPEGVAKLRELILTLAVQGKLVPQDASDEPASVLLERIQAEKARLVAEGKIKKEKPLAEISEEEKPFELPVGWEWARLGNVQLFTNGYAFKSLQFSNSGVGIVRIGNVQNGEIIEDGMVYLPDELAEEVDSNFYVNPDDLVITMTGDVKLGFNKTSKKFLLNQRVGKIKPLFVIKEYLVFCLSLVAERKIAEASGSVIPNVSTGEINLTLFALPPLAEQSRIVARVESLMQLCDALEAKGKLEASQHQQLLQTLLGSLTQSADADELAHNWQRLTAHFDLLLDRPEAIDALEQTILQLAVRGLLVPQDPSDEPASELLIKIRTEKDRLIAEGKIKRDKPLPAIGEEEKPFELPGGWEWVNVATVFETTSGGTFSSEMEKESGTYMYVKVGDMNLNGNEFEITTSSRFVDPDENNLRGLISSGSIIFPKRGGAIATNKKRVVIKPIFVDLNTMAITPILISTEYAFIWLMTIDLASLNTGTSVPQINHKDIEPLFYPLPPLAEQSRIVTRVNELRALCQQLREQLSQARQTQSLLAQAWVAQSAA